MPPPPSHATAYTVLNPWPCKLTNVESSGLTKRICVVGVAVEGDSGIVIGERGLAAACDDLFGAELVGGVGVCIGNGCCIARGCCMIGYGMYGFCMYMW